MKKVFTLLLLFMLATSGINAQTFAPPPNTYSQTYSPNLPIGQWDSLGMSPSLPTSKLFNAANLINTADGKKAVIESTSTTNGIFNANLLYTINGQMVMKISFSLRTTANWRYNNITNITITDVNGKKSEMKYDGSERSAGEILGALTSLLVLLYKPGFM